MMVRTDKFLLIFVCILAGSITSPGGAQESPRRADLAITGATIVDGTGAAPRAGATLLIADGRVVFVGEIAEDALPAGATVIDGRGKYVIPGLADMHVHLGTGGLEAGDGRTAERVLRQFLFYGVTTVLSLGGTGGDTESIAAVRSDLAAGKMPGPAVYASGSLLTLPGSHPISTIMHPPPGADAATYDWSERGVAVVASVEAARAEARAQVAAGMDAIKIVVESGPTAFGDDHPQMPPEMIAAVVGEAKAAGLAVVAHVTSLDELEDAVAAGVDGLAHAVTEPLPSPEHWERMRRGRVFYIPTLALFAPMMDDARSSPAALRDPFLRAGVSAATLDSLKAWKSPMAALPPDVRADNWRGGLDSIGAAHAAGVAVTLGTDTANPFVFPGHSAHLELELLVQAGLTPMEALVAATRRPAELLGEEEELGILAPGRRADLLILAADPLADIRNTRTLEVVIQGGRVVDRERLLEAAPDGGGGAARAPVR